MSNIPAARLLGDQDPFPFGEYRGRAMCEVPEEHLKQFYFQAISREYPGVRMYIEMRWPEWKREENDRG